jgi:hypothetical protein
MSCIMHVPTNEENISECSALRCTPQKESGPESHFLYNSGDIYPTIAQYLTWQFFFISLSVYFLQLK